MVELVGFDRYIAHAALRLLRGPFVELEPTLETTFASSSYLLGFRANRDGGLFSLPPIQLEGEDGSERTIVKKELHLQAAIGE